MKNVLFSTPHETADIFLRQTQNGSGVVGDYQFIVNDYSLNRNYSFLVVFDKPEHIFSTNIPKEHRILVITEPPLFNDMLLLLEEYGHVICSYPLPNYTGNQIKSQSALNWHFGINRTTKEFLSLEQIKKLTPHEKLNKVSVICSNKSSTPEQIRRLKFVKQLQEKCPELMDFYGKGSRHIDDKRDAILPYQYHIVLENNQKEGFWTEKLADAFLGYSFPFYSGGEAVEKDFPENSFIRINLDKPDEGIEIIKKAVKQKTYERYISEIKEAREMIIYQHNLFPMLTKIMNNLPEVEKLTQSSVIHYPYPKKENFFVRVFNKIKRTIS